MESQSACKRILLLAVNYWPEPTAIGPLTTDLADYLAGRGWRVTVVTGFPHFPQWSVFDGYTGKFFRADRRGLISVLRVWQYIPRRAAAGKVSAWKRIAYDTTFALTSALLASLLPRHEVVLAVCPPLQTGLVAGWLKAIWKAPVLFWIQDIVTDAAVGTGMLRPGPALELGRWLEKWVYRRVDRIGIISRGFQANLEAKNVPQERILFLPNWADMARFDSGPDGQQTRRRLGFAVDDFVLVHAGNVGVKQCLNNVVHAMKRLESYPDIHLLIAGGGNCLEEVQAEARRLGASRVRFLPPVVGPDYVDLLRAADVLLVNQAREVKEALIPSKLLTYLPSERPVIAAVHAESETARFIGQARCGVVVEPQNPDALAGAILRLRHEPETRRRLQQAGAEFIRQHFDRPVILKRFEEALTDLASQSESQRDRAGHWRWGPDWFRNR